MTDAGRPRRTVISLATGDRRFAVGLERLAAGLGQVGFDGAFESWRDGRFPPGCPTHLEVPFAFKPYCFAQARDAGAQLVLWLDSSCVPVLPLDGLFDEIGRAGYLLFANRAWVVGEWASDLALERFGVTREEAMRIPEVNAAALGLGFGSDAGNAFLDRWQEEARAEVAFRGIAEPLVDCEDYLAVKWNRGGRASTDRLVRGHRHDQTVAGLLAHELGLRLRPAGLEPIRGGTRGARADTVIVNVRSHRRGLQGLLRR